MRIEILTLFPRMFEGPFSESIVKRAGEAGFVEIRVHDIRQQTTDRHHVVDDTPYGGGAGMVMKAEPLARAIRAVKTPGSRVVLLSAQGALFDQAAARRLAAVPHLVLVAGHYEGVDERVIGSDVDEELSIGDYVLTGGELPAMVVADAVVRLVPGVIEAASLERESHTGGLLEGPQYTRPVEHEGRRVPPVLLSGDHPAIEKWRRSEAIRRTAERRPDLLANADLTPEERARLPKGRSARPAVTDAELARHFGVSHVTILERMKRAKPTG